MFIAGFLAAVLPFAVHPAVERAVPERLVPERPRVAAADPAAPDYSPESIANPITASAGPFAAGSFLTIYGNNLAYVIGSVTGIDKPGAVLPTVLIDTNLHVLINHIPANMLYVSPQQINILIPTSLVPGPATVQVVNQSLAGPPVTIMLDPVAPALVALKGGTVLAAHLDGTLVAPATPAHRGELVVVYAMGLGTTVPPQLPNQAPDGAASISDLEHFQLLFNTQPVDAKWIPYVGISPPYAGIYQINLFIPDTAPDNPEIQISFPNFISPAAGILPIQ